MMSFLSNRTGTAETLNKTPPYHPNSLQGEKTSYTAFITWQMKLSTISIIMRLLKPKHVDWGEMKLHFGIGDVG